MLHFTAHLQFLTRLGIRLSLPSSTSLKIFCAADAAVGAPGQADLAATEDATAADDLAVPGPLAPEDTIRLGEKCNHLSYPPYFAYPYLITPVIINGNCKLAVCLVCRIPDIPIQTVCVSLGVYRA